MGTTFAALELIGVLFNKSFEPDWSIISVDKWRKILNAFLYAASELKT